MINCQTWLDQAKNLDLFRGENFKYGTGFGLINTLIMGINTKI